MTLTPVSDRVQTSEALSTTSALGKCPYPTRGRPHMVLVVLDLSGAADDHHAHLFLSTLGEALPPNAPVKPILGVS